MDEDQQSGARSASGGEMPRENSVAWRSGTPGLDPPDVYLARKPPLWRRYGAAVLLVATALLIDEADFLSGGLRIYLVFYPFIVLATLYGGIGPGLLAISLSCVAACVFLAEPGGKLAPAARADILSIALFIIGNLAFVWLTENLRRASQKAARAEAYRESAVRDASYQRRVQEELLRSESQLKEAQRLAHVGSWQWEPRTDTAVWSEELYRILGRDPKQPPPPYNESGSIFTPESWSQLDAAVQKALETGEGYQLTVEFIRPDGTRGWACARGEAVRDATGSVLRLIGTFQDVTESRQTEEALRETEAFGASVRDSLIEHLAVVNENGVIIAVNRAWQLFAEANGAPGLAQNSVGVNYLAICEEAPLYLHGQEAGAARDGILEVLNGARAEFCLEYPCPSEDGRRWFRMQVSPLRNAQSGVVVAHLDITERKLAEEELHRINRLYAVLSQVNQAVLHVGSQQEFFEQICKFSTAFGAFKMAWVGKIIPETHEVKPVASAGDDRNYLSQIRIYDDERPEGIGPIGTSLREGRTYICNDFHKDASTLPWREAASSVGFRSIVSLPLRKEGKLFGALAVYACELNCFHAEEVKLLEEVAANVSFGLDHLELETRRQQNEVELRHAKEGAEAANRAKEQFLAVLSHELRTPLTPVLATVTALEEQADLPAELHTDMALVHRNVELEAALIDDLLDMTRINTGKFIMHPESVDLLVCLQAALKICQSEIEAKHLKLSLSSPALQHHVWADPVRLQQVFWNLLRNAVKFTPEGGQIRIRSINDDGHLKVEITDSGVGIPREVLPRVFNAFEQGEKTTTRFFGGLGLGLSIAKAIVELHHGRLTAASEGKDRGATFTLELATAPVEPEPATAPPAPVPLPQRSLKILLVDDHADTLLTMAKLLQRLGYTVVSAASVQNALDRAAEESFDLLISDLGLPDGSGLDIMREARGRYGLHGIALSGYGTDEDIRQSREAGFEEHIIKPVSFDTLRETIQRVVAKF